MARGKRRVPRICSLTDGPYQRKCFDTAENGAAARLRINEIRKKKFSRGGRGVILETAILHRIFAYAVSDCELLERNPVKLDGRPGDDPTRGARPFKVAELAKLRDAAGIDLLAFLLLRWTGLR
jgi:hypothetical protein